MDDKKLKQNANTLSQKQVHVNTKTEVNYTRSWHLAEPLLQVFDGVSEVFGALTPKDK